MPAKSEHSAALKRKRGPQNLFIYRFRRYANKGLISPNRGLGLLFVLYTNRLLRGISAWRFDAIVAVNHCASMPVLYDTAKGVLKVTFLKVIDYDPGAET